MMLTFMACSLACPRVPDAVRREAMRRRAGTYSISVDVGPVQQRVTNVPRSARDTN